MANTNTKNDESSIVRAPQLMTPACFRIAGIAMLPTAEAPVKNLVALAQLLSDSVYIVEPLEPAKNNIGIGRNTYIIIDNIGHQLLYKAQAKICKTIPPETRIARKASFPVCEQARI